MCAPSIPWPSESKICPDIVNEIESCAKLKRTGLTKTNPLIITDKNANRTNFFNSLHTSPNNYSLMNTKEGFSQETLTRKPFIHSRNLDKS